MWYPCRMQESTDRISSYKMRQMGKTAASIRILLELPPECNSAASSLQKVALQKKREVLTEHLPQVASSNET